MRANLSIKRIFKQIYTLLLWIFIGCGLIITLTFLLLQTPIVKEFLAQKVVEEISDRTDHRIELGQIHISWLDHVLASDLHLYDLESHTLIKADQVEVNFDLFGLFNGQTLFFDDIVVQGAELNLIRYPDARSINLKTFLDALSSKPDSLKETKEAKEIRIASIELISTRFLNRNLEVVSDSGRLFDFNDLALEIEEMIINDLSLKGSVLKASVLGLQADHSTTDLKIMDLKTSLYLDNQHLTLADLEFKTPNSYLTDSVALSFNHFGNLSNFSDSVQLDISLRESSLSLLDLQYFAAVPTIDTTLLINLEASGVLSRLSLSSFLIGVSSGTYLEGTGFVFGLPATDQTFCDLQISAGLLHGDDLKRLTGDDDFEQGVSFDGDFVGFLKDFVAAAEFRTDYGDIKSDINVKIPGSIQDARYTGGLELSGFDAGRVLEEDDLGSVSLTAQVEGAGITKENVDLNMDVKVSELVFSDYAYDSLTANGRFKDHFFDGDFAVFDPHCQLQGRANIELAQVNNLEIDLDVDSLHLQELNLLPERLDLEGSITGQIADFSIDNTGGKVKVENLHIRNDRGYEHLPLVEFQAATEAGRKLYSVKAPDFDAQLEGDFMPSELIKDLPAILQSYFLLLTKDRDELAEEELLMPEDTATRYNLELDVWLKDVNSYMTLLGYPVYISENTVLEAEFSRRKNINLNFFCEVDSLKVGPDSFGSNTLEVSASRNLASTDVLALIQMSSQRQTWSRTAPSSSMSLEWVWFNNEINSQLKLEQPAQQNSIVLNNEVKYLRDSILFKILPSDIVINGNTWRFDRDNYVSWVDENVNLHELEVHSGDQSVYLDGQYALDTLASLAFGIENFDLVNLDPLLTKQVEGRISLKGNLSQLGNDNLRVDGQMNISDLTIEGLEAGDLEGQTAYDSEAGEAYLDLNLVREGIKTIDLSGTIHPFEAYDQIDVSVGFDQANINLLQPFLKQTFRDISGYVSGKVNVGGPLDGPTFFGNGAIQNGRVTLDYTNTSYTLSGPLAFDSYEVSFRGVDIRDDVNGKAKLYGSIYHDNLTEIQVDFLMSFQNLRLLNTSSKDNDIYYGRIFGTGDLRLSGSTSNLTMGGEVTTVGNTRVFFPLESSGNVFQEDYITFVDPRAERKVETSRPLRDAGVTVDLALNVTPDAYAELIFDAQKGDIIRGRAEGGLQVKLSQSGEFTLLGGLEIQSGAYNFTVPGINKEFQLRKGGTINWSGDPYQGQIDLHATYRQVASLQDWDPNIESGVKIPFLVVLDLQGEMMKPDIIFSIETEDVTVIPGTQADLRRFLLTVNDREDELNRQVFSLLMLRKLSPQNSFQFAEVGRGISSSVSEILSNQLSYWLSQSDENLEVDIDLAGLDQDAFNTFQYRLAYSFFDGRLKVSGGNSLDGPAGSDTELPANNNNLFDNWSVEYLISPDGRLRVKVFSRVNPAFAPSADNFQETGASVQYVRSFNHFRELIARPGSGLKDRSAQPLPQGAPEEPNVSSDF